MNTIDQDRMALDDLATKSSQGTTWAVAVLIIVARTLLRIEYRLSREGEGSATVVERRETIDKCSAIMGRVDDLYVKCELPEGHDGPHSVVA